MKKGLLNLIFILFLSQNIFAQMEIVGGEDANIQEYPYQAALMNNWYAYCGASIINEYWILTAAHCVDGESASNTSVRVGSDDSYAQGGDSYDAAEIISHPNYNSNTMNNDIALIRLEDPISFNTFTQPVVLMCEQQVDLGVEDVGEMSWITGWGDTEGTTNSSQLQVVGVPITNTSDYGNNQIDPDMIMAGYEDGGFDSCQGDSGGPMVVLAADGETFLQSGIVSWGYGCAEAGYPGVYSRVSYFIDWICDETDGDVCPNESLFCNDDATFGCTDLSAENYDANATVNDGSCEYSCDNNVDLTLQLDCYGEEISWTITNENNNIVAQVNSGTYPGGSTADTMEEGGSLQQEEVCLSVGCYTFTITDSYGDGLSGSEWTCTVDGAPFSMTDEDGIILFEETDPAFGDCSTGGEDGPCSASYNFCISIGDPVYGCTDVTANNYDENANTDDGSCEYLGCTDPLYLEYDSNANVDDGSCITLIVEGCTDPNAENYNGNANVDNGDCEYLEGCTDPNAENYNPEAVINDGSCEYSYSWEPCNDQNWFEGFETYDDSNIDSQSGDWLGWDGANSGVDVTDDFAFLSNQSILVEEDDDLIHMFDNYSGSGEVIFYMFIPSGDAGAYYNMLHDYDGNNSNWAFQVLFASQNSGEQSFVDLESPVYFDALYDTWVEVRHEIDIDNDVMNLYYNTDLIANWDWSGGSAGASSQLDALNFYGFCTGSGCEASAWYDNIEVCSFDTNNSSMNDQESITSNIFPNPNNGSFELSINHNIKQLEIQILDIVGKLIYTETIENYNINEQHKINTEHMKGTYFLRLSSVDYNHDEMIIIK